MPPAHALTLSADTTRIALAHADHAALHDATTGAQLARIDIAEHLDDELVSIDALPSHFAIALRRTLLLVRSEDFTVVARHRIDPIALTLVAANASRAVFASAHQVFVLDLDVQFAEHTLRALPIRSARVAGTTHGAIGPRAVAVDREVRRALVVPSDRHGTLFDLEGLVPVATLPVRSARPGFGASGSRLLDGISGTLWDASTGAPVADLGTATGAAWCGDGSRFLLLRRRDAVVCDTNGRRLRILGAIPVGPVLAITANRAVIDTIDGLVLVDLDADSVLAHLAPPRDDDTAHPSVRVALAGTRALVWMRGSPNRTLALVDLADGRFIASIPTDEPWHPRTPLVLAGTLLTAGTTARAWDLGTGTSSGDLDLGDHAILDVAAIPGTDSCWVLTSTGTIRRLDLASIASNP